MERFRLIWVMLLAVFAFAVMVVSVAQAETAPFYTVGGTRLVAGKTHNVDARAIAPYVLTNATDSVVIECKSLGTEGAVLLGSNAGTNGSANGVAVFSQCVLAAGNGAPECELANETGEPTTVIKTEAIKSELVENLESAGHPGKKLLKVFLPVSKAKGFVTLFFRGSKCTVPNTIVSGSTVAEVLLDNAGRGNVELGQTPKEATSSILRFPATSITRVWLVSGGVGKESETGQVSFNTESIQTGTALSLLASTKFTPEPSALWSALP